MSNIIKEKIKKEADGYGTLTPAFIEGANFALENLWINFKEKEPPNRSRGYSISPQMG